MRTAHHTPHWDAHRNIGTSFAVTIIDPNAKNKVPEMRYITEPSETYLPKLAAALHGGG